MLSPYWGRAWASNGPKSFLNNTTSNFLEQHSKLFRTTPPPPPPVPAQYYCVSYVTCTSCNYCMHIMHTFKLLQKTSSVVSIFFRRGAAFLQGVLLPNTIVPMGRNDICQRGLSSLPPLRRDSPAKDIPSVTHTVS